MRDNDGTNRHPEPTPKPRWLDEVARGIKRICGMPDYEGYLAHLRARHPERPLPSEREYFDLYVKSRYSDGPTRCC